MRNYTERELREVLGQEMAVSEQTEERLKQAYTLIRSGQIRKRRKSRLGGARAAAAAAAAAVFAAGIFCVSNPAVAAKLPLIGHIFAELGQEASYPGDYEEVATVLTEADSPEADGTGAEGTPQEEVSSSGAFSQTSDGLTVTLSEVYCNEVALYLTMELKSEEPFGPPAAYQDGTSVLYLQGSADFSFREGSLNLAAVEGELSGKLVDEHTCIALYRMDLKNGVLKDDSAYVDYIEQLEAEGKKPEDLTDESVPDRDALTTELALPEQFTVQLTFDRVIGDRQDPVSIFEAAGVEPKTDEELIAMPEEEWETYMQGLYDRVPGFGSFPNEYEEFWYDGPFAFDLDVTVDQDRTVTRTVEEDVPEDGEFHVLSVTKTPFELSLEVVYPKETQENWKGGITQVLDADGRRLETGSHGGMDTMLSANGHDLSKIDIYYLPWDAFEQTVKGDYFDTHDTDENGKTMKELLEENSVYHREVSFE